MKQTIDISPEKVAPIAAAALRFFALETTLVPGNLRQQLAVLEVFLAGLSTGELLLATPVPRTVESDVKIEDKGDDPRKEPEKVPGPTSEEIGQMRDAAYDLQSGAGTKEPESG